MTTPVLGWLLLKGESWLNHRLYTLAYSKLRHLLAPRSKGRPPKG